MSKSIQCHCRLCSPRHLPTIKHPSELPEALQSAIQTFYSAETHKVTWQLFANPSGDKRLVVNFEQKPPEMQHLAPTFEASNESSDSAGSQYLDLHHGKSKIRRKRRSAQNSETESDTDVDTMTLTVEIETVENNSNIGSYESTESSDDNVF